MLVTSSTRHHHPSSAVHRGRPYNLCSTSRGYFQRQVSEPGERAPAYAQAAQVTGKVVASHSDADVADQRSWRNPVPTRYRENLSVWLRSCP